MHRRLVVLLSILAISTSVFLYTRFTEIDLISDLVVSLSSLSSCGTCIAALVPLKTLANLGDEPFVRTFVAVCSGLGIQEPEVCRGAIGTQAPTIAHSLREISVTKRTAALFCANIFGLCPYPDVAPWSVPFKTMKPKKEVEWKSKGRKPLRVVHLSDLHIDRQYLVSLFTLAGVYALEPLQGTDRVGFTCIAWVGSELYADHVLQGLYPRS